MHLKGLQLEYTSCRRGQGGGKGFQTRAATPGVRPDEQREIEARGGYVPPRDAITEPTPEDIERDFPVLFRSYRLSSGRFAFTRSQYSGRDYSERWGNFFAHTLVVEGGPPTLWPVDYYEWSGWKTRLEPDDDDDALPPPLPEVALGAIQAAPSFALTELREFLEESPGRPELLASMIRAVFFGPARSRALVVRDSALNGTYWVACVQKAFPLRHSLALSLSTYQFDPRDSAALNATTTGSNFTFDQTQRTFQFCMFDLIQAVNSDIPDDGAEYASTVARWMAEQPERLGAFHMFMAEIEHDAVGPELTHLLRLFRTSMDENADGLTVAQVVEALDAATRYLGEPVLQQLFAPLTRVAARAAATGSAGEVLAVLGFLVGGLVPSSVAARASDVANLWTYCFKHMRKARRWENLPPLSEVRDDIAARAPEAEREIARSMLSEDDIEKTAAALAAMPAGAEMHLERLLGEIVRSAQTLGDAHAWDAAPVRGVIARASRRVLHDLAAAAALLKAFDGDPPSIAAMCAVLLTGGAALLGPAESERRGDLLGQAFAEAVAVAPDAGAALRRALDQPATWPVLFGEWRAILTASHDRARTYDQYREKVLVQLPGFDRVYRGRIARSYADGLDEASRTAHALAWLMSGQIDGFESNDQAWYVETAAKALALSRDHTGVSAAREVARRAQALGLALDPDRPFLRLLLEDIHTGPAFPGSAELERLPATLGTLTPGDYRTFLGALLRVALPRAQTDTQQAQLVRAALLPNAQQEFLDAYRAALSADGNALPPAAVAAALGFWLMRAGKPIEPVVPTALEALTDRLARMRRADYEAVQREFESRAELSSAARTRWMEMQDDVAQRNRSVLDRLGSLLRRDKS